MSLPPVTVHIKRKATDEPVDFLRVHELHGKRQRRATDFVFSRQAVPVPDGDTNTAPPHTAPNGARRSDEIQRASASLFPPQQTMVQVSPPESSRYAESAEPGTPAVRVDQSTVSSSDNSSSRKRPADCDDLSIPLPAAQVRRFHMSRTPAGPWRSTAEGQTRKRGVQPAIFIERKGNGKKPQGTLGPIAAQQPELPRPQKRPGLAARSQAAPGGLTGKQNSTQVLATNPLNRNVRLPSGLIMPWDVNSEQLAAEMQAYTLQEIGKNLAEAEATRTQAQLTTKDVKMKKQQSRFKPKKPALRYHERHPNEVLDVPFRMDTEDRCSDEEMEDDSEYIIDTYVRMPAEVLETSDSEKNVGLLVLDSQPDIDRFYLEDSDSSEEEEDEDEDENGKFE
ncbi:hypothetical protein LARI1_G007290 [Lachnellula arida]|uniref:Transcription factor Iwr1 domain-containing protein n=1 Tax=Lachnellula arida TaxID=1316785 RepID=A0A8T9BDI5_9HELO|nr:hypothetical protein LARI1_G007290 [Lachnellula arida]